MARQYILNGVYFNETADREFSSAPDVFINEASLERYPWVKHAGTWKQGRPYARHSGTWKSATAYVRHAGVWATVS